MRKPESQGLLCGPLQIWRAPCARWRLVSVQSACCQTCKPAHPPWYRVRPLCPAAAAWSDGVDGSVCCQSINHNFSSQKLGRMCLSIALWKACTQQHSAKDARPSLLSMQWQKCMQPCKSVQWSRQPAFARCRHKELLGVVLALE